MGQLKSDAVIFAHLHTISRETGRYHHDNCVVTSGFPGCRYDNPQ